MVEASRENKVELSEEQKAAKAERWAALNERAKRLGYSGVDSYGRFYKINRDCSISYPVDVSGDDDELLNIKSKRVIGSINLFDTAGLSEERERRRSIQNPERPKKNGPF